MLYYRDKVMKKQVLIEEIEKKIYEIKQSLVNIGPMRPGTINEQFKDPKSKSGAYYQLNYTHKMKTRTEYVRKNNLEVLTLETEEYQRFKGFVEDWIALSIEASKLRIKVRNSKSN